MSAKEADDTNTMTMFCASCGIAGGDDIILKDCSACHLVKYCSVKCQKDHRPKHKRQCKKRAAELRDEILFKQPDGSHLGDCPICVLPLPFDGKKSNLYLCCSKRICEGCCYTNGIREREGRLQHKCPFCREPLPKRNEQAIEQVMKRIAVNDSFAMCYMGGEKYHGGDYKSAFEYWTRAAALGEVVAHYQLSIMYGKGQGVEKDEKKRVASYDGGCNWREPLCPL